MTDLTPTCTVCHKPQDDIARGTGFRIHDRDSVTGSRPSRPTYSHGHGHPFTVATPPVGLNLGELYRWARLLEQVT